MTGEIVGNCKFGNFRENFIFAKSAKRHVCDVKKKSRTGHDLRVSVNDRVISPIREGLIFTKLRICEVSRKLNSRENFRNYSNSKVHTSSHFSYFIGNKDFCCDPITLSYAHERTTGADT